MLEEKVSATETIYIRLLNEGTDVWRPTIGQRVGLRRFRVLATPGYDPEDEEWEFLPGTIVECETRTLSGAPVLVALRQADANPHSHPL